MLLFPDPRPLVDRLGREFFRAVPETPGVYLMRDAADAVLYVGKAKNLRKRLGSYRVANPDRMPRRHLRLLRAVVRIELLECLDETSALARESELLLSLRPRFNRAGTWRTTPRFLVWKRIDETLGLAVTESPETGWEVFGPLGSVAPSLRKVSARLLWCALHPEAGPSRMPAGWASGRFEPTAWIEAGSLAVEAAESLQKLFSSRPETFIEWVRAKLPDGLHLFDRSAIEADLEFLTLCSPLHHVQEPAKVDR